MLSSRPGQGKTRHKGARHGNRKEEKARVRGPANAGKVRYLNGGLVTLEADNFADEVVVADAHELVHGGAAHFFGRHDCIAPRSEANRCPLRGKPGRAPGPDTP